MISLTVSHLAAAGEKVSFTTPDGVKIVGDFYKPASRKKLTLILLHGLGSVRQEWSPFDKLLASKGYGVFVYDARGHSESNMKVTGENIDFKSFYGQGLNSEWGKMINDVGAAIKYLKTKYNIDPRNIAVGGASIGANVAFRYASAHAEAPCAILLSPGIDYQGIKIDDVLSAYGSRPLFVAVSPLDRYSYSSVQSIIAENSARIQGKAVIDVYTEKLNQGHGTQMFKRKSPEVPSDLENELVKWIQKIKL